MKKGISLVSLIITIIVLIILTGAVIMSITGKNSTIDKANEAVMKNNLATYKEEFTRNIMQKQLETGGTFDRKALTNADLKNYVPSATDEDIAKLSILNGELKYVGTTNEQEFELAAELNMVDVNNIIVGQVEVGDYVDYQPTGASSI